MRWHTHGDATVVLTQQSKAGDPLKFLDDLPSSGTACVTWPYAKNNRGYAQINIEGKKWLATRIVCERTHGPAPTPDHVAAHDCGKGHLGCIAPWHLQWKTPEENRADMHLHGTISRGDRHATKLNSYVVRSIRTLLPTMAQSTIAERFGISQSMVSQISTGKAWGHLS